MLFIIIIKPHIIVSFKHSNIVKNSQNVGKIAKMGKVGLLQIWELQKL